MSEFFKTYHLKSNQITRRWHLIDAKGEVLGRLASRIAYLLMGKHKKEYSPHLDMGDYVVVINSSKIKVTGKKLDQKVYFRHSGYPGGLKKVTLGKLLAKNPGRVIELAVKRMLPSNRLRTRRMRRLRVFADEKHPYSDKIKNGNN